MLTDNQLKHLIDDVVKTFQDIEDEMLNKLGHYLSVNDSIGGSAQWQIKKLQEISNLNGDLIRTLEKYTTKTQDQIREMFEQASLANFVSDQTGGVELETILQSVTVRNAVNNFATDMVRQVAQIRTNTINTTKEDYLRIVDRTTLETTSGVKSFTESLTDSLAELGEKGITGQLYRRPNGDIVRYNIEGLIRRDALTGVFAIANQSFLDQAKTLNIEYVYVSQHLGARTSTTSKISNHAGWQGKIYRLEGKDDEYGNFYEETGAGTVEGFGGVNCRHRVSGAFRGMKVSPRLDEKENYEQEQRFKMQRYLERGLREWKRKAELFRSSGNEEEYKKANLKVNEWSKRLTQFTKKYDLRRDYSRERIATKK